MSTSNQDLVEEYTYSWVETHKKSGLLFVTLKILSDQPMWSQDIQTNINKITGWGITERGLYRSLHRMEKQGLLSHTKYNANRTGADRKIYEITDLGASLYDEIKGQLKYLKSFI